MFDTKPLNTALLGLIAAILSCFLIRYSAPLLIPFVLSCFLAMIIQPVLKWFNRFLPESISLLFVVLILTFTLVVMSVFFLTSISTISAKVPDYNLRLKTLSKGVIQYLQSIGIPITWGHFGTKQSLTWLIKYLTYGLSSIFFLLAEFLILLFTVVFIVLESKQLAQKVSFGLDKTNSSRLLDTISSITEQLQQYMLAKTLISMLTGVCTTLIAFFFGIDFPILWGITAFLLNYIPNIGSTIAVIPPVLTAFLQHSQSGPGIGALVCLLTMQTIIGNFLDPRFVGHSIKLSPLVVFLSMLFWGWMWGVLGMILAVPLTVSLKITCEHFESLRFIAILLGEAPSSKTHPPSKTPPPSTEAVQSTS